MCIRARRTALVVALCQLLWPTTQAVAQVLIRISEKEITHQVTEISGEAWLAMKSGAFRVRGNALEPVLEGKNVTAIAGYGSRVLLGTRGEGLFSFGDNQTKQLYVGELAKSWITEIVTADEAVWLGTQRALYRATGKKIAPILEEQFVNAVRMIDDDVWAATSKNAYRIDRNGNVRALFSEETAVAGVFEAAGSVWLITEPLGLGYYGPCFLVDGDQPRSFIEEDVVFAVSTVDGEAWFATKNGVFRRQGRFLTPITVDGLEEEEFVDAIWADEVDVWLGSSQRAYRKTDKRFAAVPRAGKDLSIKGVTRAGGQMWLWGETGAYRFDPNVKIHAETDRWILGTVIRARNARYDRDGEVPYDERVAGDFRAILQSDRQKYDQDIEGHRFASVEVLERKLPWGNPTLYWLVRDRFGNQTEEKISDVLVVPHIILVLLMLVLWLLLAVVVFLLAPWSRRLMALIMRPCFRHLGTIGLLPALFRFRGIRRFLLISYVHELVRRPDLIGWGDLPAEIDLGRALGDRRKLLYVGDLDLSRQYMRSFAWKIGRGATGNPLLSGAVPVPLELRQQVSSKEDIEQQFAMQLAEVGRIADLRLGRSFLRRGGFCLLVTAPRAPSTRCLDSVMSFVKEYGSVNLIIFCIEESRSISKSLKEEFGHWERFPVSPAGREADCTATGVLKVLGRFRACCQHFAGSLSSEAEVQRMLWVMLRAHCDRVIKEENLRKLGEKGYRPDFGIPEARVLVEAKFISEKTKTQKIQDEILADVPGYLVGNNDYDCIVFLVYDAAQKLKDSWRFVEDISSVKGVLKVIVIPGVSFPGSAEGRGLGA